MARNIPSISALLAFESAARHENFTDAASDLSLTPGAVSKQIRKLEEDLAISLFERYPKGVKLTKIGKVYFDILNKALNDIEEKTDQIRSLDKDDMTIVINIAPSFCNWLIDSLHGFQKKYPELQTSIVSKGCGNLESANADISIYASKIKPQDCESHLLYVEKLCLIAHPSIKISKIDDIKKYKMLEHQSRPGVMEGFLKDIKLNRKDVSINSQIEHFSIIIEMVKNNIGLGLVPEVIIEDELKNGTIINPLNIVHQSKYSYYLTYPKHKFFSAKISKFRKYFF